MSIYPETIKRCQRIKVNGIQCGSPALRGEKFCFFHTKWRETRIGINARQYIRGIMDFPVLEDANSIQISVMQVLRMIVSGQLDSKTAGLLLYGLQTASNNLSRTTFEPLPRQTVIDPDWVADTCLGDNAWEKEDFEDQGEEEEDGDEEDSAEEESSDEESSPDAENNADEEEVGGSEDQASDSDSQWPKYIDPAEVTDEQIQEIYDALDELGICTPDK